MSRRRYSNHWGYFPKTKPIPVEDGIKARTKRGQFGEHWWARRWIEVLESFGWDNRLQRGRTYARKGQVLNIEVRPGQVTASVQGSRRRPYTVRIEIAPLNDKQWERAIDAMAEQALFAAQLLAGEMPPEIEQAFQAAGVSLFPNSYDVGMNCSCPDWAVPCKHIAAVYYLLGEEFDRDPFLLFTLRGCTREHLMTALRARRATAALLTEDATPEEEPKAPVEPLDADLAHFWEPRESLGEFHVTIAPPPVKTALLKRLGLPPFSRRPEAFVGTLTLAYAAITDRALRLAFGEDQIENSEWMNGE
ncbi:MAG: SWIM zinc finger family protein [Chloroflexota bacterium]|nr:SWIM zinc finger family protein [Chloroflexota bacterium]